MSTSSQIKKPNTLKSALKRVWEYITTPDNEKLRPEFDSPIESFSVVEMFTSSVELMIYSAFLALPVAFLSAYPESIPQFIGGMAAEICTQTGQCDLHVIMGATGLAIYILSSVLLSILIVTHPRDNNTPVEDHFDSLSEQISQLYDMIEKLGGQDEKPE